MPGGPSHPKRGQKEQHNKKHQRDEKEQEAPAEASVEPVSSPKKAQKANKITTQGKEKKDPASKSRSGTRAGEHKGRDKSKSHHRRHHHSDEDDEDDLKKRRNRFGGEDDDDDDDDAPEEISGSSGKAKAMEQLRAEKEGAMRQAQLKKERNRRRTQAQQEEASKRKPTTKKQEIEEVDRLPATLLQELLEEERQEKKQRGKSKPIVDQEQRNKEVFGDFVDIDVSQYLEELEEAAEDVYPSTEHKGPVSVVSLQDVPHAPLQSTAAADRFLSRHMDKGRQHLPSRGCIRKNLPASDFTRRDPSSATPKRLPKSKSQSKKKKPTKKRQRR